MSTYTKLAAEAGDQYLAGLEKRQENYLKMVAATSAWLPKAPKETKAAASMLTPKQLADLNFSFANKLLEQQKAFAGQVLSVNKPASSKSSAVKAAPAKSRTTSKASAKKATTKKAKAKPSRAKA